MEGRCGKPYGIKQEEPGMKSEYCGELPFPGAKLTSSSTSKRRRAVQKKVVSIPIGDVHGSRLKGDGAPPSDSWAWRKYGQKPIKGSPYPRGYYRCSSSKGCPARKQVERNRVDPAMLVVTYACDHNHAGPASKNHNTITKIKPISVSPPKQQQQEPSPIFASESEDKFPDLTHDSLLRSDDFTWFSDVAMPESPIISAGNSAQDTDVAMIFPMGEEDESLFADLGELPECSVVFRRGSMEQEERRRCTLGAG